MNQYKQVHGRLITYCMATLTLASLPIAADAQTTTYRYDARGRLVGSTVTKASGAVTTDITYDKADNRSRYAVSGSTASGGGGSTTDGNAGASVPPGSGAAQRFVIVPLNGFTVIPIS